MEGPSLSVQHSQFHGCGLFLGCDRSVKEGNIVLSFPMDQVLFATDSATLVDKILSHAASFSRKSFDFNAWHRHALTVYNGTDDAVRKCSFAWLDAFSGSRIGWCFLEEASYLNHSCCPNLGVWWTHKSIVFVALRDLVGEEELFISYVDELLPHEERQSRLESSYAFTCSCARCRVGEEAPTMDAIVANNVARMISRMTALNSTL